MAQTSATLNAVVNPNEQAVSGCYFEFGVTENYGESAPCTPTPGSGETPVVVSARVVGLNAGTTYHFRIASKNQIGTSYGSDLTFKTLPVPPGPRYSDLAVESGPVDSGCPDRKRCANSLSGCSATSDRANTDWKSGKNRRLAKHVSIHNRVQGAGAGHCGHQLDETIVWCTGGECGHKGRKRKARRVLVATGKKTFSSQATAAITMRLTVAGKALLKGPGSSS